MKYLFFTLSLFAIISCKPNKSTQEDKEKLNALKNPMEGFSKLDTIMYFVSTSGSSGAWDYPRKDLKVITTLEKGKWLDIIGEKDEWYAIDEYHKTLFVLKEDTQPENVVFLSESELNLSIDSLMHLSISYSDTYNDDFYPCDSKMSEEVMLEEDGISIPLENGQYKKFKNLEEDEYSLEEITKYYYEGYHKKFGFILNRSQSNLEDYLVVDTNGDFRVFSGIPFLSPDAKYIFTIGFDLDESHIKIYENNGSYRPIGTISSKLWKHAVGACGDFAVEWDAEGNVYFYINPIEYPNVYQSLKLDFSKLREFVEKERIILAASGK